MAEPKKRSPKPASSRVTSKAAKVKAETPADAIAADAKPSVEADTKPPVEEAVVASTDAGQASASESVEPAVDYEVVTPPPTVDPRRGGGFIIFVLFIAVLGFGTYATWPLWSPYVAPRFPALEFKPAVDPLLSGLAGRLEALEAQSSGQTAQTATINDMEKERARLQHEVGQLLQRLESIEKTISGVKEMVVATGVKTSEDDTQRVLEEITARLAELEKTGDHLGTLNERVDQLETETAKGSNAAVEQVSQAKTQLNSMIGKLEDRLTTLEATGVDNSTSQNAAAIILAVSQLRKSAISGEPFDKDADALQVLAKDHLEMQAALSVLQNSAKTGTATIDQLRSQFASLASKIVRADNLDAGNSWFESAKNRVQSLVSIRKLGSTSTSTDQLTVDSVVVLTEDHLRKGDIAAAVKVIEELKRLSLPAFAVAEPWLAVAKSRLITERAVASLHVYAVALIASDKS
ncbi:MAG: hypothetical protein HQ483_04380 [Rhodospirillales bacterium]|nr:hypothetical protein [Rhodospirillales bacterium]